MCSHVRAYVCQCIVFACVICVCIWAYVHARVCVCVCVCTRLCEHVHVCAGVCKQHTVCISLNVPTRMCVRARARARVCVCVCLTQSTRRKKEAVHILCRRYCERRLSHHTSLSKHKLQQPSAINLTSRYTGETSSPYSSLAPSFR